MKLLYTTLLSCAIGPLALDAADVGLRGSTGTGTQRQRDTKTQVERSLKIIGEDDRRKADLRFLSTGKVLVENLVEITVQSGLETLNLEPVVKYKCSETCMAPWESCTKYCVVSGEELSCKGGFLPDSCKDHACCTLTEPITTPTTTSIDDPSFKLVPDVFCNEPCMTMWCQNICGIDTNETLWCKGGHLPQECNNRCCSDVSDSGVDALHFEYLPEYKCLESCMAVWSGCGLACDLDDYDGAWCKGGFLPWECKSHACCDIKSNTPLPNKTAINEAYFQLIPGLVCKEPCMTMWCQNICGVDEQEAPWCKGGYLPQECNNSCCEEEKVPTILEPMSGYRCDNFCMAIWNGCSGQCWVDEYDGVWCKGGVMPGQCMAHYCCKLL